MVMFFKLQINSKEGNCDGDGGVIQIFKSTEN
jgi:hypothetical protein